MKKILFLLLFVPASLFGQGAYIPARTVFGTVNGVTRPIAGAKVTVCAANTGGIPCSPALANTVFQDSALTVPLANPFSTDSNGNYPQAALAAGTYTITESASGFAGFSYQLSINCTSGTACTVGVLAASSATITGAISSETISTTSGPNVFGGAINAGSNPITGGTVSAASLSTTGNATIGGPLGVTGASTLNGGTLNGSFSGNPTFSGTPSFGGFSWSGTISGNPTINNSPNFAGTPSFHGGSFDGTWTGNPTFSGTVTINSLIDSGFLSAAGLSSTRAYRDCRQDGVVCDGVTEDGAHINACFTNAIANFQNGAILPAEAFNSGCLVSTSLNMTNRSGFQLYGGGMGNDSDTNNSTRILCNTGTSTCVDRTGSSKGGLHNIVLTNVGQPSPSTVMMLMGRDNAAGGGAGPFCFAEFNHDEHLQIITGNDAVVNGGRGYVGIYDVNAELYQIEDSDVKANVPAWFDTANTLSISSAYQTLQTGCPASMTGVRSINTGWTGLGNNATHIINLQGSPTGDFTFEQTFFGWGPSSGCNAGGQFAIDTGSSTIFGLHVDQQSDYELNCAPGGFLFTNGNLKSSYIHPQTAIPGAVVSAWFVPGASTTWTDVDLGITRANTSDTKQNLLGTTNTATITGSKINFFDTAAPFSATNTTVTSSIIQSPGFTDSQVTLNAASHYALMDDSGISIIGGLGQTLAYKRIGATNGSTVVSGDFAISAGWGTTASKSFLGGTDGSGFLGILSSGTGQAANPTITFTFHDGAWASGNSPNCMVMRADFNTAPTNVIFGESSSTSTQIVWGFNGTPVAGNTYSLKWYCENK